MGSDMNERTRSGLKSIQAGLGNPETGQIGAFVPYGVLFIPGGPVTLEKSRLRWEVHWKRASHKTPTRGMFDAFIKLWDEPDEATRRFAERWGPLAIDGAGNHLDFGSLVRIDPWTSCGFDCLSAWRYFSRRAYSVLKLASELKRGSGGNESDWCIISSPHDAGPVSGSNMCAVSPFRMPDHTRRQWAITANGLEWGTVQDIEGQKRTIANEIDAWLRKFGVSLSMDWVNRFGWQLKVSYAGSLLSAVALQLALAVMRADGFFICSGCETLYARTGRRPNAGENNYCPKCGRTKAVDEAGRRLRQKRADARRLHSEGKSAAEIAKLLGVQKVQTVRGWIAKGK